MKKVTFAESQTVHRVHQDEAFPRSTGISESKMGIKGADRNFNRGLKIIRPLGARTELQLNSTRMSQVPKTMTAAPFLKYTALTPAQREFLYTIAASYSTAHVRNLITQHYLNVLHRCIRAGSNPDGDDLVVTSLENEREKRQSKTQSEDSSRAKHKGKHRQARPFNTSASKHRKAKKNTTPILRRKTPRRARRLQVDEDEEEEEREGLDDSLSECFSSLSVGEWEQQQWDNTSSDL